MIPFLLASVGGYLIGNSMKESQSFSGGGEVDSSAFDQLKKGHKIKITFSSSISNTNEVELLVKSKNLVGKGKSYECEKITFINTKNPDGVRFYAYKRKNGDVGFAIGDLAIYNVQIKEKFADGGETDDDMGVQFIDYKDKMIMFEPHFKKYYSNDVEFDSLEKAKKYIDFGSKSPSWERSAYRSEIMANGGMMADGGTIELYYVQDANGNVKNISKSYEDADRFWEKSLKFNGDIRVAIVPKEDWEKEKVSSSNIKRYAKGGKLTPSWERSAYRSEIMADGGGVRHLPVYKERDDDDDFDDRDAEFWQSIREDIEKEDRHTFKYVTFPTKNIYSNPDYIRIYFVPSKFEVEVRMGKEDKEVFTFKTYEEANEKFKELLENSDREPLYEGEIPDRIKYVTFPQKDFYSDPDYIRIYFVPSKFEVEVRTGKANNFKEDKEIFTFKTYEEADEKFKELLENSDREPSYQGEMPDRWKELNMRRRYAKGGAVKKDIDGYVVYFGVFRAGASLTPIIIGYYDDLSDAEKYVEERKAKKEKGLKIKELYKMPINSEVRMSRDNDGYKKVKNYLHSEEKVDDFFKGKDSFYKKNYSWVKPEGYVWDNWELKKA